MLCNTALQNITSDSSDENFKYYDSSQCTVWYLNGEIPLKETKIEGQGLEPPNFKTW